MQTQNIWDTVVSYLDLKNRSAEEGAESFHRLKYAIYSILYGDCNKQITFFATGLSTANSVLISSVIYVNSP